MINKYEFGLIAVNGKEYRHDVVVFWNGLVENWERFESHNISSDDILFALSKNPEIIIIGTGGEGVVKVSDEAKKAIIEKGLNLAIEKTEEATMIFNNHMAHGKKVAGLFHLTC